MWIAKLELSTENTLIGGRAAACGVDVIGFPLSSFHNRGEITAHVAGTLLGEERAKRKFIATMGRDARVRSLERNRDFVMATITEPLGIEALYGNDVFHVAPIIISSKGYELLTVGSFTKPPLQRLASALVKNYGGKLLSVSRKKLFSVSAMRICPDLTARQRQAVELAIRHCYYASPRKTDLVKLAALAGVSYSTFHAHLRKAEGKLFPYAVQ